MTVDALNRKILRFALPNILSNISVPLLGTVDTALMGHIDALHIASIGIASMIFNFLYWNMGFLRIGTTGLTARFYGEKAYDLLSNTILRSMLLVAILSMLFLIFQTPLKEVSIWFFNLQVDQVVLVEEYYSIRIWAAPAALGLMVCTGVFFGLQNAFYPLLVTILINVVNILGNFLFVYGCDLGISGVAWATLIAQYLGFFLSLCILFFKFKQVITQYTSAWIKNWILFWSFLKNNVALFIRTLSLTLSFVFFYRVSAQFGVLYLAANTVLLQFLNWMSFGVDGFAHAAESILGNYLGERNKVMIQKTIKRSFLWGMGFAALYTLVYFLFDTPLILLFTSEPEVVTYAQKYVFWMWLFPLLATPCYIWDGIYVGFMASRAMMYAMLLALIVFVVVYYGAGNQFYNHGLWASFLVFMVGRSVFQWLLYRKNHLKWYPKVIS